MLTYTIYRQAVLFDKYRYLNTVTVNHCHKLITRLIKKKNFEIFGANNVRHSANNSRRPSFS